MTGFAGIFRSIDGIVSITDSENDENRTTGTYSLSTKVEAVIFRGIEGAKKFCDDFLKNSQEMDIQKFLENTKKAFDEHHDDYKKFDFSMVLVAYVKPRHPVFFGLWYDVDGHHVSELPDFYLFTSAHQDLVSYLISKVYSEHMLLDEIMKLVSYVSLQCIKIFPIGYDFEITTVTEKGIKKLSPGETKDIFHNSEKVDHKLKKTFSDFFICGGDNT